jgi:hypothetical protein
MRYATRTIRITLILSATLAWSVPSQATTVDFESVTLDSSGFDNGAPVPGGPFNIDGASLHNEYTDFGGGFFGWNGWSVSNHTDTTTPGIANQYSSFAGGGASGSSQYGVMFSDTADITFAAPETISGAFFTNMTYSALSMLNGDSFAKQFGGASGTDPDWFNITIEGLLGAAVTGSQVFYLADYRFADSGDDYVLDQWTWVDLSGLGVIDELRFTFGSSDIGTFGINTPTYAAMDFLVSVPEPNTALLCAVGLLILSRASRHSRD